MNLALSLGAFALIDKPPAMPALVYTVIPLFGFLILRTVWNNYSGILGVFPIETRELPVLNMVLLLVVVLEPYLPNIISVASSAGGR